MNVEVTTEPASTARVAHDRDRGVVAWVRRWWPLIALGAGAVAVSLVSRYWVFPAFSWNRDEPVYLWQVHVLRDGHVLTTDGGAPAFFQPWLTGHRDGSFFSQYTLGWPLVLFVADVVFGNPALGIAFGAMLAVVGTYALAKEVTNDRSLALVAAGVMLASPIIPIQGGVYLGYLFTLGLGLFFAVSVLSGIREQRRWKYVVAGALLGWIFLSRPFDALLWGAAVFGYAAFVYRREWRKLVPVVAWFAVGALPLVVVTLAYNVHVTGKVTEFPITAADPLDKYGFGTRRIAQKFETVNYTVGDAIWTTGKNGFYLPLFLAGTYIGVVVSGIGAWWRRRETTTLLLLALIAVFPLGYFFFWGMHVSAINVRMSGPIYFVPLYAPLAVLMAGVLVTLWRERRGRAVALLAVLVVATVPLGVNRIHLNQSISRAQRPWRHATDSIRGRALVFVADSGPYLLFLDPFSENDADLNDRVLFAADRGASNLDLIRRMPDRTPYRELASFRGDTLGPRENPNTPTIKIERLRVLRGGTVSFRVRVTNVRGLPVVAGYFGFSGGGGVRWRVLSTDSHEGATYDLVWNIAARDLVRRQGAIVVGAGYGRTLAAAQRFRQAGRVEQYFQYQVARSEISLLVPPRKSRMGNSDGYMRFKPAFRQPELDVDPRAVPTTP